MNTLSGKRSTRKGNDGRHKPVRWFSALISVAVLAVSGAVVADVVLSYALTTNIGATGKSPFTWNEGSNYAAAHTLNIVTATGCTAGLPGAPLAPSQCYSLTTSVNGVPSVSTIALNSYEFDLIVSGDAWSLASTGMTYVGATQGATPVGCAFAVISDAAISIAGASNPVTPAVYYQPTLAETLGGEGAGGTCTAAVTTVGVGTPALNAACNTAASGSTAGYAIIDLLTGTLVASSTGFTCNVLTGTTAPGMALSVSYMVYAVTGATATGAQVDLNSVVG